MPEFKVLHSVNGSLEKDFDLVELEKRLEMLILKPTMAAGACDDFWCDDNSCATGQNPLSGFGICDGDRNCDDFCDDHDKPGGNVAAKRECLCGELGC